MRLRLRGRRTAALAALMSLALAAPVSATVSATAASGRAPAPTADDVRQYEIHVGHNTPSPGPRSPRPG